MKTLVFMIIVMAIVAPVYAVDGYPYANSPPDIRDQWMFYTRECTSYCAWVWNDILGIPWYNTRVGSGSAWNWPALAADQGYSVDLIPQVWAICSWPAGEIFGPYGHVAIVEAIYNDGTFYVSQYNWWPYAYSEMLVSGDLAASARFIYPSVPESSSLLALCGGVAGLCILRRRNKNNGLA